MLDLNPVYNYFSSVYAPKSSSKYESHNKNELKNLYHSIVKKSTDSPLYKVTFTNQMRSYALGVKDAALQLNYTTNVLSDQEDDAFSKMAATSSNPSAVGVTLSTSDYDRLPNNLSVHVNQVATSQRNEGAYLPIDHLAIAPNNYSFSIQTQEQGYNFNFAIHSSDNNLTVQKKLVNFINQSDIGIQAYVKQQNRKSAIYLESEDTGTTTLPGGLQFNISDDYSQKGLVEAYGLNEQITSPTNAHLSINGQEQHSTSNHILLNKMIELDLKNSSDHDVTIGFQRDTDDVMNKINEFTDSYNQLISIAHSYSDNQRGSHILLHDISSVTQKNKSSLESLGFLVDDDGTLTVDESLIAQNIQSGSVKDLFQEMSAFKDDLSRQTTKIAMDPMNYVDKTMISYKNPKQKVANPYMTSIYSGMLFNGYV